MGGSGSGKPKAALLRLDGTQKDLLGNVTETDFFKFLKLPSEHFCSLEKEMTPEQALKFRNHVVRMKVGTSAMMPMLCSGSSCVVKQCPFHEYKNWKLAEPCPLESNLIATWTMSYVQDLDIDPNIRTEMILVNQLVECDLIDYRANAALGANEEAQTLLKVDTTTVAEGIVNEATSPHPLLEIKDRISAKRMKVLESLSATRKERDKRTAALGLLEGGDAGEQWAVLKKVAARASQLNKGATIDEIKEELKQEENDFKIQDADWEIE